jgi:peptidoglycan/xylan/chitin deacetylase (PgdA/CDA1 family)
MIFTTSWDDGYKLDLKLADLLEQYGCKGTFYVCPRKQHDIDMLSEEEIRSLHDRHEIGAHTLRHPKLTEVSPVEAKTEIEESKAWVEHITGAKCAMFCYPYGFYNDTVKQMVQDAGYKGARTTQRLQFAIDDPFTMPTTLQVTPFPKRKTWSRWWHPMDPYGPLRVRRKDLKKLGLQKEDMKDWLSLAKALFDHAHTSNPNAIFHLWGHSHEIEKYNMWGDLETFLTHVQASGVECLKNSQIVK